MYSPGWHRVAPFQGSLGYNPFQLPWTNQLRVLIHVNGTLPLILIISMGLSGCASTSDKLQVAAANDDARRVTELLEAGADPSDALDDAARAGHTGIVEILLGAGADPSGALDDAARAGHAGIVGILLGAGADPSGALDDAARAGHAGIVGILLGAGADPSGALDDAARAGHAGIVGILLGAGADPSGALDAAAEAGHAGIVGILLEAGADPSDGLVAAARRGRTEIAATLLKAGGDPDTIRWTYGGRLSLTPLHAAAMQGHLETVKLLVEVGADIEARTLYKAPGLGEALAVTFFSSLVPLMSADDLLNTDLADMDGWTPLQFAAAAGHTGIVELLTEASVIATIPAAVGKSAGNPIQLSGIYTGGLRVAIDSNGAVTGRYESHRVGLGTVEQPQFGCVFSFYGFPVDEGEKFAIASWDPPVWRPDAAVEEGINTTGTLHMTEGSVVIRFVEDPSGGCWNVEPFTQGSRFSLRERRAWSQVRLVARDNIRLLASPGGATRPEPLLARGELAQVMEERDGWLLVEIERMAPVPEDGSDRPVSRFHGWLRGTALFPVSPPGAPNHSEWDLMPDSLG